MDKNKCPKMDRQNSLTMKFFCDDKKILPSQLWRGWKKLWRQFFKKNGLDIFVEGYKWLHLGTKRANFGATFSCRRWHDVGWVAFMVLVLRDCEHNGEWLHLGTKRAKKGKKGHDDVACEFQWTCTHLCYLFIGGRIPIHGWRCIVCQPGYGYKLCIFHVTR